jgi:3-isopropylmalate/(R)-2-methylmalate dehydratase small subunit
MLATSGRAHRFGDNVTTDDVIAGKYKHRTIDPDELAEHLMENIRPGFAATVSPGDFIVAGSNFGCGSSREQAPQLIKHVGVVAVVAESFARIFFRNAINIGLLLLTCETGGIEEGDRLSYLPEEEQLCNLDRDELLPIAPLPPDIAHIVAAGGLLALVRERGSL